MNTWADAILDQLRDKQAQLRRQLGGVDDAIRSLEHGYDAAPLDPPIPKILIPRDEVVSLPRIDDALGIIKSKE